MKSKRPILIALLFPAFAFSALAGSSDSESTKADTSKEVAPMESTRSTAPPDTEFRIGIPGWITGLEGDFGVRGIVTDQDLKFTDFLKRLDMLAVGTLYGRWQRWEIFADGQYMKVSDSAKLPGLLFTDARVSLKSAFAEAFVGYRIINCESGYLSGFAGARYNYMQAELRIANNNDPRFPILRELLGIPNTLKVGGDIDWVDPVIGLSGRVHVWKPIWFWAKTDIGGFGAASDFTWQAQGGLEFKLTRSIYSDIGWRYLKYDYVSSGFTNKTEMNGPYFETGITF